MGFNLINFFQMCFYIFFKIIYVPFFLEFYWFLSFLVFVTCLGLILIFVSLLFIKTSNDKEKMSVYECGFEPFESSRIHFDVHFYLISLVFLIFDLEIFFLVPWIFNFYKLNFLSFWVMIFFLLLLLLGFIYEWRKGSLIWTKKD